MKPNNIAGLLIRKYLQAKPNAENTKNIIVSSKTELYIFVDMQAHHVTTIIVTMKMYLLIRKMVDNGPAKHSDNITK